MKSVVSIDSLITCNNIVNYSCLFQNLPSLEIIAGMFEQLCNGIDFKKYVMVLFKMLSMPVVIGIKALADVYHIIS